MMKMWFYKSKTYKTMDWKQYIMIGVSKTKKTIFLIKDDNFRNYKNSHIQTLNSFCKPQYFAKYLSNTLKILCI